MKKKEQRLITCKSCCWVYMGVSLGYARNQVETFNRYFDTLTLQGQQDYYGGKRSSLKTYFKCWCGNPYRNFREYKPGDCPSGVTIGPILDFSEKEDPYRCLVCSASSGIDDYCENHVPNSTVDDKLQRLDLNCSICPPNKFENKKRVGKYGKGKPKYKNKRR